MKPHDVKLPENAEIRLGKGGEYVENVQKRTEGQDPRLIHHESCPARQSLDNECNCFARSTSPGDHRVSGPIVHTTKISDKI